jgi:FAD/FMN-containing dehydrogenase
VSTIDKIKSALPDGSWTEDPDSIAPRLIEWRGLFKGKTPLMATPRSTEEVAEIVRLCAVDKTPLVIQSGNTGLVGGGTPDETGDEILLTLDKMNRVRGIDAANYTLTAEAGCTVASVQDAAREADRFFALSLASEGTAGLGGVISTNAGGVDVLRYGTMRDQVLGLEVVLPDGRIWDGLSALRKDNTGYDLKHLFIGAEGTLGIVTAAVIKLYPRPVSRATAFLAVPAPEAAISLLSLAREITGDRVSAFELMGRQPLDLVLRHIPDTRDPLDAPAPWYVLIEATSPATDSDLGTSFERFLSMALEKDLIKDGAIAQSSTQAADFWKLRESMSEAQKHEGASIKHDVSVPVSSVPAFIAKASKSVTDAIPGARPVPFGHVGDGNVHFNISEPPGGDRQAFLARWQEVNRIVHDIVVDMRGSISAEHGIGRLKRDELAHYKDPLSLELMRALKATLDPNNILNRNRII